MPLEKNKLNLLINVKLLIVATIAQLVEQLIRNQ